MEVAATIIMPTFNHGGTIEYAVASVLNQTISDFELFIIGDGVPESSKEMIQVLADSDPRIRFFDNPKHSRRGEPYRHQALQEARGKIVCYICDRDLWLPNHLEYMQALLQNADFAHCLSLHIFTGDKYRFFPIDLSNPFYRKYMQERHAHNRVAFSCAAHTIDMYRRLPIGWETTPEKIFTDWYMFKKFLAVEDCRCVSGTYPSAITFPSPPRLNCSQEERIAELQHWANRVSTAEGRMQYVIEALEKAVSLRDKELASMLRSQRAMRSSTWWQLGQRLKKVPGLKKLSELYRFIFSRKQQLRV
ncbi:glycosyltransferase family 2 protein [Pseudomonadota bacterium]